MNETVRIGFKPGGLPVGVQSLDVPRGQTVEEIALARYGSLHGIVAWIRETDSDVQWFELPREQWRYVRPLKDGVLTFTFRMNGGKNSNLFATVAIIGLAILAPYALGAAFPALVGAAGLGSLTAFGSLISAGIVIGGSLLIGKLFPGDVGSIAQRRADESSRYEEVSSDGNVLAREAFLPVAIDRRLSPPDLMEPRPRLVAGTRAIDRCMGLYGEHAITEIRIDGTPVTDIAGVTIQTRDGDEATGCYTFINEISVTTAIGETLPTFSLDAGSLEDQVTASNSEPRWIHFSTPGHPDLEEIAIRFRIDAFVKTDSATQKQRVPLRVQVRPKGGSTWVSLPEIHLLGRDPTTTVKDFRFRWDDMWDGVDSAGDITYEFWREVPAVTAHSLSDGSQNTTQWTANAWFDAGTGYQSTTNIYGQRSGLRVRLSESMVAKGDLEWRVMRGYASDNTALNGSYQIGSVTESLFVAKGSAGSYTIAVDQGAFVSQLTLEHATAIADRYPVEWPRTAIIALRSTQSLRNITCHASRRVLDWNGSAWATETTASTNPATHYHQFLLDFCNEHGLDTDLIDSAAFVSWRAECAARGYACSAVFAGESMAEILSALATAGFAREVFGLKFSIDWFRDRESDVPVQLFSPRNSNIAFALDSPQRPFGLRVTYDDADNDNRASEIEVAIDNAADIGLWEKTSYKAISSPALVRRRATFDLLQTTERRRKWTVETAIEGVLCEVGDLASVVSDLFDDTSHGTRVRQVLDASTLVLDQAIPGQDVDGSFSDNPAVADILTVGETSLAFVHTSTGIEQRTITAVNGNVIVLDSALSTTPVAGTIVTITTLSNASHRCFVLAVERLSEERAKLTLVDEAPQIWETMERLFG